MVRTLARVVILMMSMFSPLHGGEMPQYRVEQVASGLSIPWGIAFLNPKELIITERDGRLWLLSLSDGRLTELEGAPEVLAAGQGGLLDVKPSPYYEKDRWIYFTYSKPVNGEGATTIARARRSGNRLVEWEDLLVTRSITDTAYHYGSRMVFDHMGHLYFTVGDRGRRPNGQDLSNHAGTILRIHPDGTIPDDNPFVGVEGVLPEIWSYGHRNPQGIAMDRRQRLWTIEHGPRGGDELNRVEPGNNYGWPVISYGKEYWGPFPVGEGTHRPGMEQPVKYYVPSIAPGSLISYSGKAFPQWRDNLFAGALKLKHLNRIEVDEKGSFVSEERLLLDLDERIRAVAESPEGWIYLSTDSGQILRLVPTR